MIMVIGSVNVDFVIRGARLPRPGETVVGGRFFQARGGKGANQAVAAARASTLPVVFVAAVGDDDLGRAARNSFKSQNINCDHLHIVPDEPTGVALIMVDDAGENAISVASGANARLTPEHIDRIPDAVFRQCRVLLASLEVPRETVLRGLTRAQPFGTTTILNPAPADSFWGSPDQLGRVNYLTPNENEAVLLAEQGLPALESAQWLASRSPVTVLLTQGAGGVTLFGPQPGHFPAVPVTATDTTAAGDAFNGALAAGLAENQPLAAAVQFATVAAGISVTREGAQTSLPHRTEILAELARRG